MAIRPVVVSFQAEGVREIQKSFQAISNAAAAAEKATVRSNERATTTTLRSHQKVSESKKKETKAALDADEKLAASKKKLAAQIEAIERRQSDRKMREIERELRQSIAADERAAAQKIRISEKAAAAQKRIREREAAAEKRIYSGAGRLVGGSTSRALGSLGGFAGGALAVGGGFSVVDSLQTTIANLGKAQEIALNSGGELTRDSVLNQAHSIAVSRGFEASQVLAAVDRFGATSGDYVNAPRVIDQIAALANATGGDMAELASAAGLFQANGGDATRTQEWLRVSAGMGRAGSVDVRDLAQYGAKVSSASGSFADQSAAFVDLSAMTQMAVKRGGASDAAEATTSVQRFAGDVWKSEDALKALGVKTRDATGTKLRGVESIMTDAISATRGDRGKLGDIWKLESIKSIEGYRQLYNEASTASKSAGGDTKAQDTAGRAAIAGAIQKMREAALTEEQVKSEAAKRMEETDKKLTATFERLRIEVGDKLAPKFLELIPVLERAIPAFTDMLDFAVKNPFSSVGILIAGAITKDIAAAGIGKGVELVITQTLGAAASSASTPLLGLASSAGAAAAAIAAIIGTKAAVDYAAGEDKKEQNKIFTGGLSTDEARAEFDRRVASANGMPPEELQNILANARAFIAKSSADEDAAYEKQKGAGSGVVRGIVNYYGGLEDTLSKVVGKGVMPSGGEYGKVMDEQARNVAQGHMRATESIERFAKRVDEISARLAAGAPGKSNDNSPDRVVPIASPARSSG